MKNTIVGKVLDNYRILQNIGRGGMGFVFKALNIKLNKTVAIKMIAPALAMNDNFMRRFEDEAKALAKLENPNIVRIYDLRSDSDYAYIVMEYVEGITLGRLIKEKGSIPWPHALKIFKQMLNAIEHAHKEGIIHRDIKPNNVLLNRQGLVKITDFGLAKNQAEFGITQSATTGGTLFYMSPEQVKGLAFTDERSDIYALGFTLYEMLAGKTPFTPEHTDFDIREAIIRKKFPPPHQLNKKIPAKLGKIVDKAIQKQPEDRYQNMAEFIAAIDEFLEKMEEKRKRSDIPKSVDTPQAPGEPAVKTGSAEKDNSSDKIAINQPRRLKRYLPVAAAIIFFAALILAWPSLFRSGKPVPKSLVSITSIPNKAFVFINGDSIGETPIDKYSVETGAANILLVKDQFFSLDTSIRTSPELPYTLNVELAPSATVALRPDPADAEVMIDGRLLSADELSALILPVGDHLVRLFHPKFDSAQFSIALQPGENEPLTLRMDATVPEVAGVSVMALAVSSNPDKASVYLDDSFIGNTPLRERNLAPGAYRLRLSKSGFADYTENITLSQDQPLNIDHKFTPLTGSIRLSSTPVGASVLIDGQELKSMRTPLTLDKLPVGEKQIVLRKDGYADFGSTVMVTEGNTREINADMQALLGALSVHAIPWGTIFVDDKLIKQDSNVKQKLDLTVGEHRVKATHPTLGTYEKTVRVERNKLTQVEVNFNQTHTVKITALDSDGGHIWADIFIDGEKTGDQTPKEMNLRTGTYTIDVARSGYISAEGPKKISIDGSMDIPIEFVLKKTNE